MRKAVVLLMGVLMLGGMMGMVSADFSGNVLHVDVGDTGSYYLLNHTNPFAGTSYDVSNYLFNVSYDVAILNYTGSGCIAIQEVLLQKLNGSTYTYGFYYCGVPGEVVINSTDPIFDAGTNVGYDVTKYNPPYNFRIEVASDSISFYINNGLVRGSGGSFKSALEIHSGTATPGVSYDIYIDNIIEKVGPFTLTENFDDNSDDYFLNDVYSGTVTKEIVPASAVPFFSNAALALLLALAAVWLFKRK